MAHTTARSRESHALLTVRECAQRLRVSQETIRRRVDDGSLAAVKLGSVRRVFASELDRLAGEGDRR
jgi:excisionase family DNA binding protein